MRNQAENVNKNVMFLKFVSELILYIIYTLLEVQLTYNILLLTLKH